MTSTNAVGRALNNLTVSAKTPYTAIYYADVTGLGLANPINTLCFMTGGTYTPTNTNILSGSTGCFAIGTRDPFDIRNCLCSRSNLSQSGADNQPAHTHQEARTALGCDVN